MLTIPIEGREFWDEKTETFIRVKPTVLKLEHSLISISKWESKWHKSFIDDPKTDEEVIDYLPCMSIKDDVDPLVFKCLTREDVEKINAYIEDPMTATTIRDDGTNKKVAQKITSELIYYWMILYNIPHEFEKWHLNRLIMLIRVCSEEQKPKKNVNKMQTAKSYRELNKARKAALHTKG